MNFSAINNREEGAGVLLTEVEDEFRVEDEFSAPLNVFSRSAAVQEYQLCTSPVTPVTPPLPKNYIILRLYQIHTILSFTKASFAGLKLG